MPFALLRQKWNRLMLHPGCVPLLLLIVSVLAYGLLIPWLHLYIDDWIWHWTWDRAGADGLARYFSTNRPVLGWLYRLTLPLLFPQITAYHVFALLARWFSGLACWWFLRLLWPDRPQTALIGALLFLLYPGFALQPIALTYGHIFLTYTCLLLSLCLNLLALRERRRYWWYTVPALALSLANLFLMEYFFTLEAARLFVLWLVLGRSGAGGARRAQRAAWHWLPYLLAFGAAVIWRVFLFPFQSYRYELSLLGQLRGAPLPTLARLAAQIGEDLAQVSLGAWWPAIQRMAQLPPGLASSLATLLVAAALAGLVLGVLLGFPTAAQPGRNPRWSREALGLGLLAMLAAGWPFWLTGLPVELLDFRSRFTPAFLLGAVLLLLGLIEWLGSPYLRAALLALALGLAGGYHFQIANDFRLEWQHNRQLFWQIAWRAPDLQPGTLLLLTDFPYFYYNNATYATEVAALYPKPGDGAQLPYFLYSIRDLYYEFHGALPADQPVFNDNVTAPFAGNTSRSITLDFDLGQCARMLDRGFDAADSSLPEAVRQGAALSDLGLVVVDQPGARADTRWFGAEPAHTWCYYFETAELARQRGDWQAAARLGDEAAALGYTARDEMEKLVFLEAYARTGQWQKALDISQGFTAEDKRPMLCRVWQRIEQQAEPSPAKDSALQAARAACPQR